MYVFYGYIHNCFVIVQCVHCNHLLKKQSLNISLATILKGTCVVFGDSFCRTVFFYFFIYLFIYLFFFFFFWGGVTS